MIIVVLMIGYGIVNITQTAVPQLFHWSIVPLQSCMFLYLSMQDTYFSYSCSTTLVGPHLGVWSSGCKSEHNSVCLAVYYIQQPSGIQCEHFMCSLHVIIKSFYKGLFILIFHVLRNEKVHLSKLSLMLSAPFYYDTLCSFKRLLSTRLLPGSLSEKSNMQPLQPVLPISSHGRYLE